MRILATLLALCLLAYMWPAKADAILLKSGTAAPYTGWLFTESSAQTLARDKELLKNKEEQIMRFERIKALDATEIEFYKKKSENLGKEVRSQESKRFWSNLGHFALGVVITGVAAKAALEASK